MKTKNKQNTISMIKLIYNPHAGTKRRLIPNPHPTTSLEDITKYLSQYQITADFYPTQYPGHATILAKNAVDEGYKMVVVAGGDGTVGEAVNGLCGSDLTLGILPLGSFMNIARMLSIPLDIEKAVMLLKLSRTRKIDLGQVNFLGESTLSTPYFFIESVGLGIEAQLHQQLLSLEQGNFGAIISLINTLFDYYRHKADIEIDGKTITTRATIINISNGPYSGPALAIAPNAKLNDHLLTVTLFKMNRFDLFHFFFNLFFGRKRTKKPTIYQAKSVKITTKIPRPVHADARLYGTTPVELTINSNALSVITGFHPESDTVISLNKRTFLDP